MDWGLRDYGTGDSQLGLEPSLKEFITDMLIVTKELQRVLRDDGVMFWNHGDNYGGIGHSDWKVSDDYTERTGNKPTGNVGVTDFKIKREGVKPKCLALQNYRLIINMVDSQGWILRNTIVWHKPNSMPSSVKDRFANSYEPVYMLTKKKNYWFDLDAVRKPHNPDSIKRACRAFNQEGSAYAMQISKKFEGYDDVNGKLERGELRGVNPLGGNPGDVWKVDNKPYAVQDRNKPFIEYRNLPDLKELAGYLNFWRKEKGLSIEEIENFMFSQSPHHWFSAESYPTVDDWIRIKDLLCFDDKYDKQMTEVFIKSSEKVNNPTGSNPGDVWNIATQPYSEAHFATFPEKLVEPMIKAGCPREVCKACGVARTRITKTDYVEEGRRLSNKADDMSCPAGFGLDSSGHNVHKTLGWSDCGCGQGFEPGIVLDPFFGSGTVGLVAKKRGRDFIGIDNNQEYCELAKKRLGGWMQQKTLEVFK